MSDPIACPVCKTEILEDVEDRGIPFLGCGSCFGLYVTQTDLAAYVSDAGGDVAVGEAFGDLLQQALAENPRPSIRRCPFCSQALLRMGFGEAPFIIIDRCGTCEEHGVWLDKRELKKMLRSCRAQAAVLGHIEPFDEEEDDDED